MSRDTDAELDSLETAVKILAQNYTEFVTVYDRFCRAKNDVSITQDEFAIRTKSHNYLAAAYSFQEIAEQVASSVGFQSEYRSLEREPAYDAIRGLRNIEQHNRPLRLAVLLGIDRAQREYDDIRLVVYMADLRALKGESESDFENYVEHYFDEQYLSRPRENMTRQLNVIDLISEFQPLCVEFAETIEAEYR